MSGTMSQIVLVEETGPRPPPCHRHPETASWRGYRVRLTATADARRGGFGCRPASRPRMWPTFSAWCWRSTWAGRDASV